jgi:hypothetical protein
MWNNPDQVTILIAEHLTRRPAMQPRDVYKLLYQGVRGPEHIVPSGEEFVARLREEYAAVPAAADGPAWEAVRPDGLLGRLNLRPFKARGGTLEQLVDACLGTAAHPWGTAEELRAAWTAFAALCQEGRWDEFPTAEVRAFTAWLEAQGWPAVHHSAGYREAYRPAYRLVARDLLPHALHNETPKALSALGVC